MGRACCRLPAVAHTPTVSRFVTTSAAQSEEPAVASTSQPEVFGRRQALSLLAVTPVLAQAQSAWAVQVCGLHWGWGHLSTVSGYNLAVRDALPYLQLHDALQCHFFQQL